MLMKKILFFFALIVWMPKLAFSDEHPNKWTGFHIGLGLGKGQVETEYSNYIPPNIILTDGLDELYKLKTDQRLYSLQFGYDYQFGKFVAGLEGGLIERKGKSEAWNWAGIDSSLAPIAYYSQEQEIKARLGYLIHDDWLLFVTAGATRANMKFHFLNEDTLVQPDVAYTPLQGNRWGWNVGAGAEAYLVQNISLRVDYSYSDYGKEPIEGVYFFPGTTRNYHFMDQKLVVSVQYRF